MSDKEMFVRIAASGCLFLCVCALWLLEGRFLVWVILGR